MWCGMRQSGECSAEPSAGKHPSSAVSRSTVSVRVGIKGGGLAFLKHFTPVCWAQAFVKNVSWQGSILGRSESICVCVHGPGMEEIAGRNDSPSQVWECIMTITLSILHVHVLVLSVLTTHNRLPLFAFPNFQNFICVKFVVVWTAPADKLLNWFSIHVHKHRGYQGSQLINFWAKPSE